MTFTRLLLQNLFYHRRGNFAVFLGVVVGTAVLTGALLVGDSLRGSLRDLTRKQLGWIDYALVNKRFFREELAGKMEAKYVSPAIVLQVSAARERQGKEPGPTARKVMLLGVDKRFWSGNGEAVSVDGISEGYWNPPENVFVDLEKQGVVLSAALAHDLRVKVGDRVAFSLQKVSALPRETLLGRRETKDVVTTLRMPVKAILPAEHFGSHFSLNPSPAMPRNAFVPLRLLQEELRNQDRRTRTMPQHPVNAIFAAGADRETLQSNIKKHMWLEDWGLNLRRPRKKFRIPAPKYLSLESREMFVPEVVVHAVDQTELRHERTLTYLVNNMATKKHLLGTAAALLAPPLEPQITRDAIRYYGPSQVPYCIVAALDPARDPPLGRFLPRELDKLGDKEILLVQWADSPFKDLFPGAEIVLSYFDPEEEGYLRQKNVAFRLAAHVPIKGPTNDFHLTPEFPGITDSRSMSRLDGWDPPFPFHRYLVSDADEEYWREHRTTPKAYINLAAGQKLWGSRFGKVTSIRIDPGDETQEQVANRILEVLEPEQAGLEFQPVRSSKLQASSPQVGGVGFGELFLMLSFFLIVAALLLIGLLFRLNIDMRASQIGLLLAVGHRRRTVRWLLLAEGALLSLLGGIGGSLVAVWYAGFLLDFLSANWPGGLSRSILQVHVTRLSLAIGYVSAVVVSLLTIFWATRVLSKVAPTDLLEGETTSSSSLQAERKPFVSLVVLGVGIIGAIACFFLGLQATDHEMQAGSFVGSGFLLLMAGLALAWLWMRRRRQNPVTQGGLFGLALLGVRNAGRHPVRSVLTMGLLASASFLVIAVQVFHRDPGAHFLEKTGGSGGYPLLAETDVPVFQNLNSAKAHAEIDQKSKQQLPDNVAFYPFRVKQGDDTSCMSLYQPRQPRLLGVSNAVIQRGGFQFAGTKAVSDDDKKNPWRLLTEKREDDTIPVFGEKSAVEWMLNSSLGGIVKVTNGRGETVKLRIVGLLRDSVFQSGLLMSDANFRKLYPRLEGFNFFLIDTPVQDAGKVEKALENGLSEYGLEVSCSADRVQTFLAVENTYLATFQALGGLGVLLGVLGLAVVLLRSVWERRGELALLRALGFRKSSLGWLVLAENSYLLVLGLLVGTVSAFLSVAPHVVSGSEVQWLYLAGFLVLVFVVGLAAGTIAVLSTLRAPLLPALRRE